MIKSMTGYGRHKELADGREITFEIRSVNNRYLDLSVRMPRLYAPLEDRVRKLVGSMMTRGKADVNISVENLSGDAVELSLNREYLEGYLRVLGEIKRDYGVAGEITLGMIASRQEVFLSRKAEEDMEQVWSGIEKAASVAMQSFIAMREAEGARMKADIAERAAALRRIAEKLSELSPQAVREANEKMKARISELLAGVPCDESRLLTECAVFADKTDVTEELVRLSSHFSQLDTMLAETAPVGRKLDFLVQELNREINTIGSKCSGTEMTSLVIEAKSEIEKIREQIQNIE